MSVVAICVLSPAMTVTVAPASGVSLVASTTTPATVPFGLPLSTLTPCEQPPPTTIATASTVQLFIDIPSSSSVSTEHHRVGRHGARVAVRRRSGDGADDGGAGHAADHVPEALPGAEAAP